MIIILSKLVYPVHLTAFWSLKPLSPRVSEVQETEAGAEKVLDNATAQAQSPRRLLC